VSRAPAPLFTAAYDLAAWLLGRLHEQPSHLARELCAQATTLLDLVAEALRSRDVLEPLDDADALLRRLRLGLRLGGEIGLLDERRMLHALGLADCVGRQLGALLRHRSTSPD
jgi:hypothetical protein